ncbi:MAG: bifunctional phosphoribosylaminoimidazolecarboxamide formyltransferase/IMP cyclohydrolase [Actinobacteria bacterium]|nr:bifunctional phosphoribosylaminoimidazolecarboxamide formyltransferase/IMP cyclohydrolase [Actinomycetota bacterium]MCL5446961.1 bifunctional phosphoribosylaminoimidazolecarboxamide formyltransferase/IMP cyclohydrolase [Actinomycetota bacterium]
MRALLSVYDKSGLVELAGGLVSLGWDLVASGGTAKVLADAGVIHSDIASMTGFGSLLSGRVKTLHPAVHAGILADRDNPDHMKDLEEQGIEPVDLVVCNLYPFGSDPSIEMIDIGGPTMVRASAKNFAHVGIIVSPQDYGSVLEELASAGRLSLQTRRRLARAAFAHTAAYDAAIVSWIDQGGLESSGTGGWGDRSGQDMAGVAGDADASTAVGTGTATGASVVGAGNHESAASARRGSGAVSESHLPPTIHLSLELASGLKYGENPHQRGARYRIYSQPGWLDATVQHAGRELSYINLFDAESAWWLAHELKNAGASDAGNGSDGSVDERNGIGDTGIGNGDSTGTVSVDTGGLASAVIVKHANPCGAAIGGDMAEAYRLALECDPVSAFGGVVALSGHCGVDVAAAMVDAPQADVIIAPSFDSQAIEMLVSRRKATRLLESPPPVRSPLAVRSLGDGFLVQDNDLVSLDVGHFQVVTEVGVPDDKWAGVKMAWIVCARTTSNAIVVVSHGQAVGVGAGQQSRVEAAEIAARKAGDRAVGGVAASDAFFPFRDGLDVLARAGVKVIVQPGGSVSDAAIVEAANEHGIAMVLTGERHFRH